MARYRGVPQVWGTRKLRVRALFVPSQAHCPSKLPPCFPETMLLVLSLVHHNADTANNSRNRKFNVPHFPHALKWKLVPGNSYYVRMSLVFAPGA